MPMALSMLAAFTDGVSYLNPEDEKHSWLD